MLARGSWVGAQQREAITLDTVEIRGLERVSEQLVRSQLEVQAGQVFSPLAVSRDIRRLYELGFFTTISSDLDAETGVLTYIFVEERFVEELRIVGNKKVKDRQIRGVLSWREGDSFFKEGYPEERDAVLGLYRSKGFLNATVDIVAEEISPSRMRVTYFLDEGRKARIKKINFVGNEALSDRRLKRVIKTRRAYWFFGGRYDEEKFEADLVNVVDAYGDVGRLEAEVTSTEFEYKKNGKRLVMSIFLREGPEYRVESIEIANNFAFGEEELWDNVHVDSGDVHNKSQINEDAQAMQDEYTDNGYINARVTPQVTLDKVKKTTHIVHQVLEGELKYIRAIDITGNSKTKDEVIRRQILLRPGERFDGSKLRISQDRLNATQYFDGPPRLRVEDDEENDRFTNLLVDVEEGKTGNFNFGGAFNTEEGIAGFGELRLNNFDITNWPSFSGGGQEFTTRFTIGSVRTNMRIGFTDPEFAGYPISVGVDLFNERFRSRGATSFTQETLGGQLRLGKRLSNFVTVNATIRVTDVDISDLDTFVNPALRELEDPESTASLTLGLTRNTANDFRDPTGGARHTISVEVAGFGLANEFVKVNHDSIWYYGIKRRDKLSFSFRMREGVAFPYGDKEFLPLQDRYFAGGSSTLRGYDFRDVGPKALTFRVIDGQIFTDEEAVGGEFRILNTLEAKYKLNDLVRLYSFFDSGGVWLVPEDFSFGDFKYSVGVGLGLQVPFLGPLRIDYGFPLNPDSDQGSGRLHLQSSLRF